MLFGIKAARPGQKKIADLDAMIAEPVGFRLLGRYHVLKPLDVQKFLSITAAWENLDALRVKKDLPVNEILDSYYEVISSAIDSISREDLNQMSMQQIGALLQLITETITGKVFAEKKTPIPTLTQENMK